MKNEILKWNTTKEETELITKIAQRAVKELKNLEYMDTSMDITAVHCNDVKLDLQKLLDFDLFNFAHDIYGINRSLNRNAGKLEFGFLPRCTAH